MRRRATREVVRWATAALVGIVLLGLLWLLLHIILSPPFDIGLRVNTQWTRDKLPPRNIITHITHLQRATHKIEKLKRSKDADATHMASLLGPHAMWNCTCGEPFSLIEKPCASSSGRSRGGHCKRRRGGSSIRTNSGVNGALAQQQAVGSAPTDLALIFVISVPTNSMRRLLMRQMYGNYMQQHSSGGDCARRWPFRMAFSIGFPMGDKHLVQRRAMCHEQETFGDLIMLDMVENMNDGKIYYTLKYLLEVVLPRQPYPHIIKADEDTYVHLPNLASWMREEPNFGNALVYFGWWWDVTPHYHSGAMYGLSAALIQRLLPHIAANLECCIGADEDWLTGIWVNKYGGTRVSVLAMQPELGVQLSWPVEWQDRVGETQHQAATSPRTIFMHFAKDPAVWMGAYYAMHNVTMQLHGGGSGG